MRNIIDSSILTYVPNYYSAIRKIYHTKAYREIISGTEFGIQFTGIRSVLMQIRFIFTFSKPYEANLKMWRVYYVIV